MLVLDSRAFGGQAGPSARIENYLGFPTGVAGMALMARAYNQAEKFGTEMAIPDEVVSLQDHSTPRGRRYSLDLRNGERVSARAVIVASGARYRRLDVENLAAFEGSSVHYWASPLEARLCAGQEVALVGGGNSAGQAAIHLASRARSVRSSATAVSTAADPVRVPGSDICHLPPRSPLPVPMLRIPAGSPTPRIAAASRRCRTSPPISRIMRWKKI